MENKKNQKQIAEERLLTQVSANIRQSLILEDILQNIVNELKQILETDRVLIYQFHPNMSGQVIAESVETGWIMTLGIDIKDTYFQTGGSEKYYLGKTSSINDIDQAGLTPCYIELLKKYQVKANLVVPILLNKQTLFNNEAKSHNPYKLWGLLIAHQCSSTRTWQESELELLDKLGVQISIALQQSQLYQQLKKELAERKETEKQMQILTANLENTVLKRTSELGKAVQKLTIEISKREIIELQLILAQERVQYLLTASLAIIFSRGVNNYYIIKFISANVSLQLGHETEEFIENPQFWLNHVHPQDLHNILLKIIPSLLLEKQGNYEYRFLHKDGSYRWIREDAKVIFDSEGIPLEIVGSWIDITNNKIMEIALLESEARFKSLFKSAPEFIQIVNLEGIIQETNNLSIIESGYSQDELIGQKLIDFFTAKSQRLFKQQWPEILEENFTRLEVEFKRKNGTIIIMDCSASLVRDQQDKFAYIVVLQRDITERKKAEELLQQQIKNELLLSKITQNIRESFDFSVILNTAVSEIRQLLNVDRVLVYQNFETGEGQVIAESVQDGYLSILGNIFNQGAFSRQKYDNYLKGQISACTNIDEDKEIAPYLLDFFHNFQVKSKLMLPIIIKDKLWGLLGLHHCSEYRSWETWEIDLIEQLTEKIAIAIQQSELYQQLTKELQDREKAEEELKKSLEEKELLLKEVHHRVKNNLQVISSIFSLQSQIVSDERILSILEDSQNRILSMALIHEKLYQAENLGKINFADYIYNLVNNLFSSYNSHHKQIKLKLNIEEIFLNLDTAIPCGLLLNELISNAFKHAFSEQELGELTINFNQIVEGKNLQLIVSDTGKGFPLELDIEKTNSLGLRLVRALTRQIRGKLIIENDNGAIFKVIFPQSK
jgi:PAS domain S-box-containing protein